ncbi:hypothetical protein RA27_20535 [Ruegeria sp. ANG-R]|uniref:hypothetical protein n=1 Tax=Ruegeria sp. ANG-R TaxID=1577903 RepID=UPI00057C6349|nr:hypothetical protein [Ruegeria sp. ANG-R]KIC38155.1 hypothetical protein RA27_20535 [Ruegeria sp. ANG-R]
MSHIANHRIKKGGKYYAADERIDLTEDELTDLPDGAVREADPEDDADDQDAVPTDDAKVEALKKALSELPESAFKKDGDIRADALKALNDHLGFETTAAAVAIFKPAAE